MHKKPIHKSIKIDIVIWDCGANSYQSVGHRHLTKEAAENCIARHDKTGKRPIIRYSIDKKLELFKDVIIKNLPLNKSAVQHGFGKSSGMSHIHDVSDWLVTRSLISIPEGKGRDYVANCFLDSVDEYIDFPQLKKMRQMKNGYIACIENMPLFNIRTGWVFSDEPEYASAMDACTCVREWEIPKYLLEKYADRSDVRK